MIRIRSTTEDELGAVFGAMTGPFGFDLPEGDDFEAWMGRATRIHEPDRARLADDDGTIAGTLLTFSFDMSVPGTVLPVAGTTGVTVRTSHRRQGLLRKMMQAHLADVADHEEAAAALWASDSAIYGRFGYGMAAYDTRIQVPRAHIEFHRLAPEPARVDECTADEVVAPAKAVYEEQLRTVPGMIDRTDTWWELRTLTDRPENRGGASKARWAVAREGDRPVGWTKFRVKDADDDTGHPAQEVIVVALHAVTASGWAGIWKYVLSHDFASTIDAHHRPVDDPIHSLLAGSRRARPVRSDGLWVRVIDVPRMFEGRRYLSDGTCAFHVEDDAGFTGGDWRLTVDGGVGTVSKADDADLSFDAEDLGAVSMGGRSVSELHRAGRVSGNAETALVLDRLLAWHTAPWCPEVF